MNTLDRLKELKATGEFHHATARQQGSRTDLFIYRKEDNGFNGFAWDCSTSSWNDDYKAVNDLITGLHVGHYGAG
jgi:hypothetical protein